MKAIQPYLMFNGNCAEAMTFYKNCLGGELFMLPYEKSPMPEFQHVKDRIMHATLTKGATEFRGSDSMPGHTVRQGDNFHMYLECEASEAETVFSTLAEKGQVTMPFQSVFWGGRHGTLIDRFGVSWAVQSA